MGTWERLVAGVLLPILIGPMGCEGRQQPALPRRPSVVVILIDTLRADHIGSFGYHRNTTPRLDEIASRSLLFDDAVSAASATFPSVNSLFSSQNAALFFRTSSRDLGIPESMTTMAEVFFEHGYRTVAVSSSPIVRASPSELNPGGGFGQGFETFDEECSDPRFYIPDHIAACVTERTTDIIDSLPPDDPFFLYVHFLDPHDPYHAPSDPEGFVKPYDGKEFIAKGHTWPLNKWLTTQQGQDPGVTQDDIEHLKDLYDAEIRSADAALGQVMDHFRSAGRYDDTLFVVLSDHGESFLENGALQHSYSLYQTELHVPLIFHWPARWPEGRRESAVVCSVDVFPTILEVVGLAAPPGLAGVAVLDREGKRTAEDRVCLSAGRSSWDAGVRNLSALRRGRWKLIHDRLEQTYQLYDLQADAGERENRAVSMSEEESAVFTEMRELLERELHATLEHAPAPEDKIELSPDAERALRSLGYID